MAAAMVTTSTTTHAMARPAFHAGPAYGEEKYGKGERNGHARDVEDVAKRVVGRGLLERLRLLGDGDEHATSSWVPGRSCVGG